MLSQKPLNKISTQEIILGPKLKVLTDKKSKCRVINFEFELPDGEQAGLIICRLKDEEWVPIDDIKSIYINFNV